MPSSPTSAAICSRRNAKSKLSSVMVSSKCLATLYLFTTLPARTPMVPLPLSLPRATILRTFSSSSVTALSLAAHVLVLLGGRRNQRLALMCTQLRELRSAAGDEPFAGEVGVRELEQVAMIKQSQLQLPIIDKGSDLPALQCRDSTEVLRAQLGN